MTQEIANIILVIQCVLFTLKRRIEAFLSSIDVGAR